ncbi:hypothetical protein ACFYZ0_02190 [Streptomyces sp. NPDC001708]|uniref:hypothetical protein n=1 Tax=Streptomyces sp. NPDC001708 TaxID=3364602 RepID=UPI0036919CFF
MADETTETEQAPKKGGRKPDPMTQLLNELKAAVKELGDYEVADIEPSLRRGHDRRAQAWAEAFGKSGRLDGLLLSRAFEALACFEHERRHALIQLAAVALNEAARQDAK